MSSGVAKSQVLSIYKSLMRESQKFANYNFRSYAIRRVRDAFRDNKSLSDPKLIKKEFAFAKDNLMILRRQRGFSFGHIVFYRDLRYGDKHLKPKTFRSAFESAIGDMYQTEKLVVENLH